MKNKAKLAFELLEQEMEVIYKEDLIRFMGGITWQEFVDAVNSGYLSGISSGTYSSSDGFNWTGSGYSSGGYGSADWGNYNGFGGPGSPIQLREVIIGNSNSNSLGAFQLGWDTKTLLTEIALGGRTVTTAEATYLGYLTSVGNLANAASAGLTVYDAMDQGLQTHHVADLLVQAVIYDIALGVPVAGWIVGGAYFIGDEYFKSTHNGISITEYYLD